MAPHMHVLQLYLSSAVLVFVAAHRLPEVAVSRCDSLVAQASHRRAQALGHGGFSNCNSGASENRLSSCGI